MIVNPMHGITLGGLALVEFGQPVVHDEGFTTELSADGTDWGNPEAVVSSIISALSDGDLVSSTRYSNRQAVIHVRVSGSVGNDLALGEKALARITGRPAEFVWQPPDLDDAPIVFDVLTSRMDFAFDDMAELDRERAYVLTLTALPWARSATKVVTPAVVAAAPTVVDNGSSTTGWSSPNGTVTTASGAVVTSYNGAINNGHYLNGVLQAGTSTRRTAAIAMSSGRYVAVDWKASVASTNSFRVHNTITLFETRREPAPTAGFTRSWYLIPASVSSVAFFDFDITHPVQAAGTRTLSFDQVLQANELPALGTTRQLTRAINPGGSVPAEGDVLVQSGPALGQTIVYSSPSGGGYTPPVSQWRTSSNLPTADASTVSGQRISLVTTPAHFEIPVDAVPRGDVQLWARLRLATGSGGLVSVLYGSGSAIGGTVFDAADGKASVTLPGSAAWAIVPIARLVLPSRTMGPSGKVRIALLRDSAVDLEMDEAWLFGMDKGRLTVVDCGSTYNRLRVTAPSLEAPFGRIEVATAADWSDSVTPDDNKVACDQTGHRFDPDGSSIFTVTSGTTAPLVSFSHYPRGHSSIETP